jgi:hypothetical protein
MSFNPLLAALLLSSSLVFFAGGPSELSDRPQSRDKILTGEDFRKGRVDLGSGKEDVTLTVQIHPGLAPLRIHIVPDQVSSVPGGHSPQHVGKIEISKQGSPGIDQVIEVQSFGDAAMLTRFFTMEDVNFDGYLDIGTLYEFGAKWGRYNYLVFDQKTGRFISTRLTNALARIGANERMFDPEHRTIHFSFLSLGETRIGETYKVQGERLILNGVEDRQKSTQGGFEIVTRAIRKGRMKVISVEKEPQAQVKPLSKPVETPPVQTNPRSATKPWHAGMRVAPGGSRC